MANKNLFKTSTKTTDTINNAGGNAYLSSSKRTLCQIAATNCFNGTFYASAQDNLKIAKNAALELKNDPEFLAKVAVYCREKGYMKDMAAFLVVVLSDIDKKLFRKIFKRVIDNGKMLRNVIQMARSGEVLGRVVNVGSGTYRHAIQEWFDRRTCENIFKASIGNSPSMSDILRMVHPKPNSKEKETLYGYFCGKDVNYSNLPKITREFEQWKKTKEGPVPDVDFRFLDSANLDTKQWTEIAVNAPWMMTRMNLNTFARHGVFKDKSATKIIADRLKNRDLIQQAKAFPYQLLVAWRETKNNSDIPFIVKESLQDAMEIAIDSVPTIEGNVQVCIDASGSMGSPVTGNRGLCSSSVSCVEVAALIASSIIRKNRDATVWTFSDNAVKVPLNPRDSVATNCQVLSKHGGGDKCFCPIKCHECSKLEKCESGSLRF